MENMNANDRVWRDLKEQKNIPQVWIKNSSGHENLAGGIFDAQPRLSILKKLFLS